MPLAEFEYVADSAVSYKVLIPNDFALAMGCTPASSGLPVLDETISPRYINYSAASGVRRTAICTTATMLATLPSTLTVDGVLYTAGLRQGESIPAFQSPLLLGPALIQGPPGAPFEPPTFTVQPGSIVNIVAGDYVDIVSLSELPPGKWFTFGQVQVNNVLAQNINLRLHLPSEGPLNISLGAGWAKDDQYWARSFCAVCDIANAGGGDVVLQIWGQEDSGHVSVSDYTSQSPATVLSAFKLSD